MREREAQERSLDSPADASPASGFSRADRVAAIDAGSLQAALDGQKAAFEVQRAQLEAEISSLNGQLGRVREALSVREDTVTDLQLRLSDSRDAHFKEKTHLQVLCVVCCVLCVVVVLLKRSTSTVSLCALAFHFSRSCRFFAVVVVTVSPCRAGKCTYSPSPTAVINIFPTSGQDCHA